MSGIMGFLVDYKVVDMIIAAVGLFAFGLLFDRFKALFWDLPLPAEPFTRQVLSLIEQDKIEEAITFCTANEKKPLAFVIKSILSKSDRDETAIENSLDIAAAEMAPKLTKRLGHLPMVANVVTMIGLFGTVIGLIVAFRAVSYADVSQKQTLLAQGISMAMTATAGGLAVAIPTMFIYSFLQAKQSSLFAEIDRHSQIMLDALRTRSYLPFQSSNTYPSSQKIDPTQKSVSSTSKVS
ncbi:MAG: MotA/TolQ/ExbB proton channel family protein [Bdellovibrionales bacterium]|nr:MotA/TolQ/ExbB proton channel family protein [Bdellovibrionales bacterium]